MQVNLKSIKADIEIVDGPIYDFNNERVRVVSAGLTVRDESYNELYIYLDRIDRTGYPRYEFTWDEYCGFVDDVSEVDDLYMKIFDAVDTAPKPQ